MLSNNKNLPESIVRAIANDPYNRGDSDYSVTQLLAPPRKVALEIRHKDEVVEDASMRIWSLLGQAVHVIAERAKGPDDIAEKRYFSELEGKRVSGQIDLYESTPSLLSDFKVTKAWAFSRPQGFGQKTEWRQQLNLQAELMRINGVSPKKLQVVGILRDFDDKRAGKDGYPASEIVTAEIPLWLSKECLTLFKRKIREHEMAKKTLPLCTSEDTWGGRRCHKYCAVNSFCDQYKDTKRTGIFKE